MLEKNGLRLISRGEDQTNAEAKGSAAGNQNNLPTIGAQRTVACFALVLERIAEHVRSETRLAGSLEYFQPLYEAFVARAKYEIRAAAPTGFLEDTLTADRTKQALYDREEDARSALAKEQAARTDLEKLAAQASKLPSGLTERGRIAIWIGIGLITIFAIAASTGLLAPCVDHFVLRDYVVSIFGRNAKAYSATLSIILAASFATAVISPLSIATLINLGRSGFGLKLAYFLFVDVSFSILGFSLLRMTSSEMSPQSVAWSAIEVGVIMAHGIALVMIGEYFRPAAKLASEKEQALGEVEDKRAQVADLEAATKAAKDAEAAQTRIVQEREEALAELERFEALAEATVSEVYLTTLMAMRAEVESGAVET